MATPVYPLLLVGLCLICCYAAPTTTEEEDRFDKLENLLHKVLRGQKGIGRDFRPLRNFTRSVVHKDCQAAYTAGWTESGVYTINPTGSNKMDVFCDQDTNGGGWTVFQRRFDGSLDFYRNWDEYKRGFGDVHGEYWLGNDNIHALTWNQGKRLQIVLGSYDYRVTHADYSSFWIKNEASKYQLHVSGFTQASPPGDSFSYDSGQKFSTKDQDNDAYYALDCGGRGAWWHYDCTDSNLNGIYYYKDGGKAVRWFHKGTPGKAVYWYSWKGYEESMKTTTMMVK